MQAEQQLDPASWLLMKSGLPDVLSREEWLSTNLPPNSKIGIDPKLTSVSDARKLVSGVSGSQHLVVSIQENLIDKIWENQPPIPLNKVTILNQEYCGISSIDKISKLRSMFEKNKSYGFVVTALDEICWLFNLRGSDIPFNPVFFRFSFI